MVVRTREGSYDCAYQHAIFGLSAVDDDEILQRILVRAAILAGDGHLAGRKLLNRSAASDRAGRCGRDGRTSSPRPWPLRGQRAARARVRAGPAGRREDQEILS